MSCRTLEQTHGFKNTVKRRLEASSGTYKTLEPVAVIFTRVWLSLLNWRFFVDLCLVLVNAYSCLTVHRELFFFSFTLSFSHLSLFLTQFLSLLFSGLAATQDEDEGRMKTKLRISFGNLLQLKSFR